MQILKKLIIAGALCASLTSVSAETVRVGTESAFPPFEFFDSQKGEITGFDIDLIKLLGQQAGFDVEIVQMGFDAIIPAMMTGTVDAGIAGFSITPERAKKVLFSNPYYDSGLSVLIRLEDKGKVNSIDDLKNQTVCVQLGTSGAMQAAKIPGATVRNFNNINEAFLELQNRGCRAVVGDRPVNGYFMVSRPQNNKHFYHLPQTLQAEQYAVVFAKTNPQLRDRINNALRDIKANGEYDKLYRKWFGQ